MINKKRCDNNFDFDEILSKASSFKPENRTPILTSFNGKEMFFIVIPNQGEN